MSCLKVVFLLQQFLPFVVLQIFPKKSICTVQVSNSWSMTHYFSWLAADFCRLRVSLALGEVVSLSTLLHELWLGGFYLPLSMNCCKNVFISFTGFSFLLALGGLLLLLSKNAFLLLFSAGHDSQNGDMILMAKTTFTGIFHFCLLLWLWKVIPFL